MSVNTVSTFLATGTILLGAGLITLLLVWVASLVSDRARRVLDAVANSFEGLGLRLAWVMAVVATLGSLYYSQIAHFIPCEYCWYQRIAMYPLVIIFGIAAAYRDRGIDRYARAIAGIGALIAAYHVALEVFPGLDTGACTVTTPCTLVWFREFGYISLPVLALTAFLLILTLLSIRPSGVLDEDDAVDATDDHGSPA